ncbi:MAG TPA: MerR family transcriptional regulator [candidate division Zixibacteria bacterium]|nr:MerR family transcriptional regulator [candidate division Zixibacteria bacterium]HBZ00062.1 MerR family transcriptional regulator [candidate division Zixibacteria bacterium]
MPKTAAKGLQGKMYYSISEVAEMVGVVPYVLRFWEKEFPHIKPRKNRAGNRTYQAKDIQRITQIKRLLYEQGFTIEGARNFLKTEGKKTTHDPSVERTRELLHQIRVELDDLLKLFP